MTTLLPRRQQRAQAPLRIDRPRLQQAAGRLGRPAKAQANAAKHRRRMPPRPAVCRRHRCRCLQVCVLVLAAARLLRKRAKKQKPQ